MREKRWLLGIFAKVVQIWRPKCAEFFCGVNFKMTVAREQRFRRFTSDCRGNQYATIISQKDFEGDLPKI
jgi:hypothetical protein